MSPVADQERTERLAEQHRREIVDAAERLVKGNGLHQLKLRDIAKESGKSPLAISTTISKTRKRLLKRL